MELDDKDANNFFSDFKTNIKFISVNRLKNGTTIYKFFEKLRIGIAEKYKKAYPKKNMLSIRLPDGQVIDEPK